MALVNLFLNGSNYIIQNIMEIVQIV